MLIITPKTRTISNIRAIQKILYKLGVTSYILDDIHFTLHVKCNWWGKIALPQTLHKIAVVIITKG